MMLAFIVGAEIAFWVVLGLGLVFRYLIKMRRTSLVLLVSVPLIDVVLLAATAVDLRGGAEPATGHGLAAAYLGFSVAFGHSMLRWADERFAHRFAGGPPPWKPPKGGWARVRYEWRSFGLAVLAVAISCAILGVMYLYVGADRGVMLLAWMGRLGVVLVFWLVFGPLWQTIFPGKAEPQDAGAGASAARR
ncbi:hypothetical protein Val02_26620 [Virgisporangium aliadipatigenens]|uniref:Uncharacterized protein n=1 Tax=Virgisporangium aliadipatigenens TaxID=741659 RepID=A0A8J4DQB2_9ACTN|nr:hypothetical protein [Virgisporangium aliadipatigenens]GIJ45776.1 hypothetical protein Val02_26620 [Virgisporangium aliadipatigenens]